MISLFMYDSLALAAGAANAASTSQTSPDATLRVFLGFCIFGPGKVFCFELHSATTMVPGLGQPRGKMGQAIHNKIRQLGLPLVIT